MSKSSNQKRSIQGDAAIPGEEAGNCERQRNFGAALRKWREGVERERIDISPETFEGIRDRGAGRDVRL